MSEKNELLFQRAGINFNDLPAWQRRGIGQQRPADVRQIHQHPPFVDVTPLPAQQPASAKPVQNPRNRRLIQVKPLGQRTHAHPVFRLKFSKQGQLWPGQSVLHHQLPRTKVDRPRNPAQGHKYHLCYTIHFLSDPN